VRAVSGGPQTGYVFLLLSTRMKRAIPPRQSCMIYISSFEVRGPEIMPLIPRYARMLPGRCPAFVVADE